MPSAAFLRLLLVTAYCAGCLAHQNGARGADLPKPADLPPLLSIDGKPTFGSLVAIDNPWKLTFAGGEAKSLAADELVQWGRWPELPSGSLVVLPGGDAIAVPASLGGIASPLKIDSQQLLIESDTFGNFKLPLERVCGLILNAPTARQSRDALLQKVTSATGAADRLQLVNGDELTGTLLALKDDNIKFETTVGKIDVAAAKVAAVILNPSLAAKPSESGLRAMLGFKDGSRLTASALRLDKNRLSVRLAGEIKLSTELPELVAIQPLGGQADYLSDLKASSYKHVPFLDLAWPFAIDRSVLDQPLRAGQATFRKGLGMHSTARITYDLPRAYRRFQSEVAIDDATSGGGSVTFRVLVNRGGGSWDEALVTPVIRGNDPPLPLSVDLTGAKRLTLLVDFADRGDQLDHADWLNARLVK